MLSAAEDYKQFDPSTKYHSFLVLGTNFQVEKRFEILEPLGTGAYGAVVSARDTQSSSDSTVFAIKKIDKAFEHVTFTKRTLREIKIMRLLKHENVINLMTVFRPSKQHFEDVYLAYELMESDLGSIIKSPQELSDQHAKFFIYQILRGLKYIHSAGILHRDLKPKNVLVNENCDLKICDFGLARADIPELMQHNVVMTDYVATRWYRAPEILLGKKRYTTAIDVWSVGLILVELLIRKALLPGTDTAHQIQLIFETIGYPTDSEIAKISNKKARKFVRQLKIDEKPPMLPHILQGVDPDAVDLIKKMLKFDPDKRLTVDEALKHPFIVELHDPTDEPTRDPVDYYDFEFEKYDFSIGELRELILQEVEIFNNEEAKLKYLQNKCDFPLGVLSHKVKGSCARMQKHPSLPASELVK